jgi:putative iron-regulated protein
MTVAVRPDRSRFSEVTPGRARIPVLDVILPAIVLSWLALGCGSSPSDPARPVVRQYAANLESGYHDAVADLEALKSAVDAFVAAPSADGLTACQSAWLVAHQWYGQVEYSRFYGGPIDQAQIGMNEWPIDETFIDYTTGNPSGGIVNDPSGFPQITVQVLATSAQNGIETIATGFHAVEFLLWGQRADQTQGPGTRPYTDYVDGGTAANQDRRRTYLQVATSMLLDDMRGLEAQWDLANAASYGSRFVGGSSIDALTDMYRGFSQMAISELFYERMDDAFVTRDRKDEESCFSESTLADLIANALGIEDAYLGHHQAHDGTVLQGPSISDLVRAKSPALDAQLRHELSDVRTAIGAIPPPFDHAVLAAPATPENMAVQAAITAYQPVQATIDQAAAALGIKNNL